MTVTTSDTPHTRLDPDFKQQRDSVTTLDLVGCNVMYIHKRMNEFEAKTPGVSHQMETWPETVLVDMRREIDAWTKRNPTAVVKGFTCGVSDGACNVALHWRPR